MHYFSTAFSSNGRATLLDKRTRQPIKAQRNGVSSLDILEGKVLNDITWLGRISGLMSHFR